MIKDIVLEKDVVTTKHYLFRGITTEFMTFGRYRKARAMANMSIQEKCFVCENRFDEEEKLSLLFNGNRTNKLCCEKCTDAILKGE